MLRLIAALILTTAAARAESGIASIYSGLPGEGGPKAANGERLNPQALTAAHPSLPFGTLVEVTNQRNGRRVVVRINDRGPHVRGRVIDLMPRAAAMIGLTTKNGIAPVTLREPRPEEWPFVFRWPTLGPLQ